VKPMNIVMNASVGVLVGGLCGELRREGYSRRRVAEFAAAGRVVDGFMREHGYDEVSVAVIREVVDGIRGGVGMDGLSPGLRDRVGVLEDLACFLDTGVYRYGQQPVEIVLGGVWGESVAEFLEWKDQTRVLAKSTWKDYRRHLKDFTDYVSGRGVGCVQQLTAGVVLDYVEVMAGLGDHQRLNRSAHVRQYLEYLHSRGLVSGRWARLVPVMRRVSQPRLPSVFSADEVAVLLAGIDTASAVGKRNYAMVLVAARLGLRASDVCGLRFADIDWEHGRVRVVQRKTGEVVDLPLLAEVGDAIIAYLGQGRPVSRSPFVFLRAVAPMDEPLSPGGFTTVVRGYMAASGIDIGDRHSGPHALRHSLAARLLDQKTPLSVIGGVLGHKSSESTGFYLRIDTDAMRSCCLDVPRVDPVFYARSPR